MVPLPSVSTALPDSKVEQEGIDEELSVELVVLLAVLVVLSSLSEHDESKIEMLPIKKNRNIKFFMVYFREIVLVF